MDVRGEPTNRISTKALNVWRISNAFSALIPWVVFGGLLAMYYIFQWPLWISGIALIIAFLYSILAVFLFPKLRWKRWRYEVRDHEIEIQRGVFIISRTIVPMVRVQHVDTVQGPILRKYDLATVLISTAATVHEIPALDIKEADELRHTISMLARVAKEDV
jgi:uncharacterized protein